MQKPPTSIVECLGLDLGDWEWVVSSLSGLVKLFQTTPKPPSKDSTSIRSEVVESHPGRPATFGAPGYHQVCVLVYVAFLFGGVWSMRSSWGLVGVDSCVRA